MFIQKRVHFFCGLAITTILSACGGSGGSDFVPSDPPDAGPPINTPKGIEGGGVVNSFGSEFKSITVGGVEYDTTDSSLVVTVDGQVAMVSDLSVGNVVRVTASTNDEGVTSVASQINQINDLEGTVEPGSIDLVANTFVVLQQTVRVVASTVFDDINPPSLEGLADGERVEVSVLPDGTGGFIATRVERDDDPDFEITGVVSSLDSAAFRFNIGTLVVDYSSANLSDFSNGQLADGLLVEVEGDTIDADGVLVARSVENELNDFDGDEGDLIEIEGYVTRFSSVTDFDVNGFAVTTNAQTEVEYGQLSDIALGVRVEVEGSLSSDSVVLASKIEIESEQDDGPVEFEAPIESIDLANSTLTVLGRSVSLVASTIFEDDSDAELVPFNAADLAVGDFVEIKAFVDDAGQFVAIQLERDDADDEVSVQGPAGNIMAPDLTIAGVPVATTSATEFQPPAFFDQVMDADVVKADGTWDGVTFTARTLEFED